MLSLGNGSWNQRLFPIQRLQFFLFRLLLLLLLMFVDCGVMSIGTRSSSIGHNQLGGWFRCGFYLCSVYWDFFSVAGTVDGGFE
uniref:Putative secreted peptide n=1 Tax=Anopheles braziliensis TaxID=58242 RepID=A0A2M3ZMQ9_9DIPT